MPAAPVTLLRLAQRHRLRLLGDAAAEQVEVTGVGLDSRRVGPGDLYAALPGASTHGARFVGQTVQAGAVAVLTDEAGAEATTGRPGGTPDADEGGARLPVLVSEDPRRALGPVSADVYGHPCDELALVGVTGTNGKTTVSTMVDELLRSVGVTTGLIGTIRSRIGEQTLSSSFTTPEAPDLQRLLREMADAGCQAVTTEVSSHALAQQRVDGARFALVVFTNLSRDHLDFHGTLAAYFAAKLRLFTGGFAPAAVVAVDDVWGVQVAALAREAGLQVCTVATADGVAAAGPDDPAADVVVEVAQVRPDGSQQVRLTGLPGGPVTVALTMPGEFNAVNAALALTSVHLLLHGGPGLPPALPQALSPEAPPTPADLAARFVQLPGVPGRMEPVTLPGEDAPLVVVDYAHTPDAVAGAVAALRAATPGRLVVVLGAGGDRDQGKRPGMGAAASAADLVVVTDDNPRTEDAAAIRRAVLSGVSGEVVEVAGRTQAVTAALAACRDARDTVLLAGKGHETGQSIQGEVHPFDDREVARAALTAWLDGRGER